MIEITRGVDRLSYVGLCGLVWPSVALWMSFPDELFLFLTNTIDLGVQTGDRYRFRA